MPLIHSKSKAALQQNMRTLHDEIGKSPHVQSRKQAIAIALETQRRAKKKAFGGGLLGRLGFGGFGAQQPQTQPQPSTQPVQQQQTMPQSPFAELMQSAQQSPVTQQIQQSSPFASLMQTARQSPVMQQIQQSPFFGMMRGGGGSPFGMKGSYASGGSITPWFERSAVRSLQRAGRGLINSSVPGRTDKHRMGVASGSYVVPADTVSHLGQNNTAAGSAVLDRLFRRASRTGRSNMRVARMSTPGLSARGGKTKADVIVAGGEYIVEPETVRALGDGDINLGHKRLDQFVMHVRKQHIKALRKLPKPKKD